MTFEVGDLVWVPHARQFGIIRSVTDESGQMQNSMFQVVYLVKPFEGDTLYIVTAIDEMYHAVWTFHGPIAIYGRTTSVVMGER